jgi:hypothetical protein
MGPGFRLWLFFQSTSWLFVFLLFFFFVALLNLDLLRGRGRSGWIRPLWRGWTCRSGVLQADGFVWWLAASVRELAFRIDEASEVGVVQCPHHVHAEVSFALLQSGGSGR